MDFSSIGIWLLDHYPFLAALFFVAFATMWLTFKISSFISKSKHIHEKVENLPCSHHNDHIVEIKGQVNFMQDIRESVRKIEEYLMHNDSGAMDVLLRKCSPYRITSFGEKMIEMSGGKNCVNSNVDFFISEIEKRSPRVALDVERYALSVLNDNLKLEYFNDVKNFIFGAPDIVKVTDDNGAIAEIPIKLEHILMVMSIYLRDKYFEKHPEINLKDFFKKE